MGCVLGINLRANAAIVGTTDDGAMVKAWSSRRSSEAERWGAGAFLLLRDGPARGPVGLHVFVEEFRPVEGTSALMVC